MGRNTSLFPLRDIGAVPAARPRKMDPGCRLISPRRSIWPAPLGRLMPKVSRAQSQTDVCKSTGRINPGMAGRPLRRQHIRPRQAIVAGGGGSPANSASTRRIGRRLADDLAPAAARLLDRHQRARQQDHACKHDPQFATRSITI